MQLENMTIKIIGCGLIADIHVEAIKKAMPNASICVCDPLPGKAELLKKKMSLKRHIVQ
jgi:pyrroline-5-carboxylate reductase